MADLRHFPPTMTAALERLALVDPADYARTRNSLTGAVSGLSPYITHGFLTLPHVVRSLRERYALEPQHKFLYELGWREYSRHLWRVHGDGIFRSLHPGVLPDAGYARELPDDFRAARTGIPVIDLAVRTLYEVGYLHNHLRMWLASYLIHLRKVSWRTGADWMIAHLLDGDLGSNHLGWQWVAGTASNKPYLFNADNVARFAPAPWHSPDTVVDTSYEALDAIARSGQTSCGPLAPCSAAATVASRQTACSPPARRPTAAPGISSGAGIAEPATLTTPPPDAEVGAPDAALVAGCDIWLVHPWALRAPPVGLRPDTLIVGVFIAEFHEQWPWSLARWKFVCARMTELTVQRWYGRAAAIARILQAARTVSAVADLHWSFGDLATLTLVPSPRLFPEIDRPCPSFSQWWTRVNAAAARS